MKTQTVTVLNKTGLHARPASTFVQTASKFDSEITIQKGEKKAPAKSILGVLTMGIVAGTEITLSAEGLDEEEAIATLVALIESKFGED